MVVAVTGRAGYNTDQEDQRVSPGRGGGGDGEGDDDDDAGDGRDDVRGGGRPLQPRLQCKFFFTFNHSAIGYCSAVAAVKYLLINNLYSQDAEDPAMKWRFVFAICQMCQM